MYPKTEYEMTSEDLEEILKACRPIPVIFGNSGIKLGGDLQENVNRAWAKLAKKMGFDPMTVRPIEGKNNRFFTAVPVETEIQRNQRQAKEAEEKRLKRISALRQEIGDKEQELKALQAGNIPD